MHPYIVFSYNNNRVYSYGGLIMLNVTDIFFGQFALMHYCTIKLIMYEALDILNMQYIHLNLCIDHCLLDFFLEILEVVWVIFRFCGWLSVAWRTWMGFQQ